MWWGRTAKTGGIAKAVGGLIRVPGWGLPRLPPRPASSPAVLWPCWCQCRTVHALPLRPLSPTVSACDRVLLSVPSVVGSRLGRSLLGSTAMASRWRFARWLLPAGMGRRCRTLRRWCAASWSSSPSLCRGLATPASRCDRVSDRWGRGQVVGRLLLCVPRWRRVACKGCQHRLAPHAGRGQPQPVALSVWACASLL